MSINGFNEHLRRIVLSGTIRDDIAAQFLEQITALEHIDHGKPITIYINTYGGSVDSALLMYDCIRTSSCPIITIGIGKVMSAGVLILASGDKDQRYLTANSRVMIHEVSGGSKGTVSDMETSINEVRRMQDLYIDILAKHSRQSKTKILKDMETTKYMATKEAIKYGIADKVLPIRKTKSKKKVDKK